MLVLVETELKLGFDLVIKQSSVVVVRGSLLRCVLQNAYKRQISYSFVHRCWNSCLELSNAFFSSICFVHCHFKDGYVTIAIGIDTLLIVCAGARTITMTRTKEGVLILSLSKTSSSLWSSSSSSGVSSDLSRSSIGKTPS
ncbi:hypothetical protein VNO78_01708 [Psophocarpus tetragonolobus]|uniref:Uncharacterized protein n=1 Tax=Psophocarpus tetragonolobus TaxID=3891 RepID=A0AAN9TAM7_PSOTE